MDGCKDVEGDTHAGQGKRRGRERRGEGRRHPMHAAPRRRALPPPTWTRSRTRARGNAHFPLPRSWNIEKCESSPPPLPPSLPPLLFSLSLSLSLSLSPCRCCRPRSARSTRRPPPSCTPRFPPPGPAPPAPCAAAAAPIDGGRWRRPRYPGVGAVSARGPDSAERFVRARRARALNWPF